MSDECQNLGMAGWPERMAVLLRSMAVVEFSSVGRFGSDERSRYQAFNSREFHPGEITPLNGNRLDLSIERACCSPYPISSVTSRSSYRVTRTAAHVRAAKHDLAVIRLIQRGSAKLSQSHISATAGAGDLLINRSNSPTTLLGFTDAVGVHQVILLLVPAYLLYGNRDTHVFSPVSLRSSNVNARVAASLLEVLTEQGPEMSEATAQRLTDFVIEQIREGILEQTVSLRAPISLPEEHYYALCNYIALHYSDPQLDLAKIANSCRISVRYVCDLFKRNDTSFARYLWSYRLERVKDWLADNSMSDHGIADLAHRAGFKSAAHLCQAFKRAYQCKPGDFRRSVQLDIINRPSSKAPSNTDERRG